MKFSNGRNNVKKKLVTTVCAFIVCVGMVVGISTNGLALETRNEVNDAQSEELQDIQNSVENIAEKEQVQPKEIQEYAETSDSVVAEETDVLQKTETISAESMKPETELSPISEEMEFDSEEVEVGQNNFMMRSSSADLISVAGQTIIASGIGTNVSPKTASIIVANNLSQITINEVIPAAGATAHLYSDVGFSQNENQPIALIVGGNNHLYIEITSADSSVTLFYDVTVIRPMQASMTAFYSIYMETDYTQAEYDGMQGDYAGTLVYYHKTPDVCSGTYVSIVSNMAYGEANLLFAPPADQKQVFGSAPQLKVFLSNDQSTLLTPVYLESQGYRITLLYSIDGGSSFQEAEPQDTKQIDVVKVRVVKSNVGGPSLESSANPLYITVEFSSNLETSLLTNSDLDGNTPLLGWRFTTANSSTLRRSPIALYLSAPAFAGNVRMQILNQGDTAAWEKGAAFANQTVELISTSSPNNIIETTHTDGNGAFSFSNITTLDNCTIRVEDNQNMVYLFDGQNLITQNYADVGSVVYYDQSRNIFPDANWKTLVTGNYDNLPTDFLITRDSSGAQSFTVTFDGNGAEKQAEPQKMTITSPDDKLKNLPLEPQRIGYTFRNWNTMSDGTGQIFDTNSIITEDITVYAQWVANVYTLSFDANGGTQAPMAQSLNMNDLAQEPTSHPIREGYLFQNWNREKDGSGAVWNFSTDRMPAADVTLYAQWEKIVPTDTDGKADASKTDKPEAGTPKTDDYADLILWMIIGIAAGTCVFGVAWNKYKKVKKST